LFFHLSKSVLLFIIDKRAPRCGTALTFPRRFCHPHAVSNDRPQPNPYHRMEIYDDERTLADIVANLIAGARDLGQPALVIAAAPFRATLAEALRARQIDFKQQTSGIELLDSEDLLTDITAGQAPDTARFKQVIGGVLDRLCAGRKPCVVMIYADMADVLVRAGNAPAALALEALWNRLAGEYTFSLVCGYSAGHFRHVPTLKELQAICDQHNLRPLAH
jgi:hypothetical protein